MFCPNCGTQNADGVKFCANCGANLMPDANQAPVIPVQPVPQAQPQPQQYAAPAPAPAPSYTSNMPPVTPVGPLPQKTNVMCIVGMITSFVSILLVGTTALISLILSIIGLISAGKKNERGKGQAITGIIISSVLIVTLLIGAIVGVADVKRYTKKASEAPTRRTTRYEETTRRTTRETTEETTDEPTERTTRETTDETADTSKSGLYLTSVGNDKTGKVTLTSGKWVAFREIGGFSSEIVEHEQAKDMSTGAIIGLFTLKSNYTADDLAKAQLAAMDKAGGKNLTGAHVKIGGYDATQAYGMFDDGTILVVWYFKGDDGVMRKITVEFPVSDRNSFNMVEKSYKLDR